MAIKFGTVLFVLGVVLGIIQLWLAPWSAALFWKLELTIGALLLIVVVVWFVRTEYAEDQANRSGGKLDE
jgi:hypothetical protein